MAKSPSWSLFPETYGAEIAAVECGKDQYGHAEDKVLMIKKMIKKLKNI